MHLLLSKSDKSCFQASLISFSSPQWSTSRSQSWRSHRVPPKKATLWWHLKGTYCYTFHSYRLQPELFFCAQHYSLPVVDCQIIFSRPCCFLLSPDSTTIKKLHSICDLKQSRLSWHQQHQPNMVESRPSWTHCWLTRTICGPPNSNCYNRGRTWKRPQ